MLLQIQTFYIIMEYWNLKINQYCTYNINNNMLCIHFTVWDMYLKFHKSQWYWIKYGLVWIKYVFGWYWITVN